MVLGMAEIQRGDAHNRKVAILALVMVLLGGAVLLVQFESWLTAVRGMPNEAARESLTTVFRWSVGIGTVVIALAGCHFWWWGRRVRHTLRFPPPGATLLRDTVVLEGQAAASRGTVLEIFGITLILCAVGIALVSWWAVRTLGAVHAAASFRGDPIFLQTDSTSATSRINQTRRGNMARRTSPCRNFLG